MISHEYKYNSTTITSPTPTEAATETVGDILFWCKSRNGDGGVKHKWFKTEATEGFLFLPFLMLLRS